jgi:type IV pilus assembly protein PilY1
LEGDDCYFIRQGIVSTLVVFGGSLYGNVAGPEKNEDTLVQILAAGGDVTGYRKSWRQNY